MVRPSLQANCKVKSRFKFGAVCDEDCECTLLRDN